VRLTTLDNIDITMVWNNFIKKSVYNKIQGVKISFPQRSSFETV